MGYPNVRPARERELQLIGEAARAFWQARVGNVPEAGLYVADGLYDPGDRLSPDGRGIAPEDRIYFTGGYAGRQLQRLRSSKRAGRRREAVQNLYGLMAHEYGHVLGLQHPSDPSDTGIMDPDGSTREVPGDWRPLAKQVLGDRYYNPRLWRKTPGGRWVRRGR